MAAHGLRKEINQDGTTGLRVRIRTKPAIISHLAEVVRDVEPSRVVTGVLEVDHLVDLVDIQYR